MRSLKPGNEVSAIILSAGKSERFGRPKAFLEFDPTRTFLEKLVQEYISLPVKKVVVVINRQLKGETEKVLAPFAKRTDLVLVVNDHPEMGRFSSIAAGVNGIARDSAGFIQNIDNPFTTAAMLKLMAASLEENKFVVPVYHGEKGHPVLLSPEILNRIRESVGSVENLRDLLREFACIEVDVDDEGICANINSQAVYDKYFAHAAHYGNIE